MSSRTDTIIQILDVAEHLLRVRGYNAFSYADIAAQLGITKASIHYYFPTKNDLCKEVIRRYRADAQDKLAQIDQQFADPPRKLELYVQLFLKMMEDPFQVCLGGMLAADVQTVSDEVRTEVQAFFADNERWLAGVFLQGIHAGCLRVSEPVEVEAQLWVAGLQGALLVARSFHDRSRFHAVAQRLLEDTKA